MQIPGWVQPLLVGALGYAIVYGVCDCWCAYQDWKRWRAHLRYVAQQKRLRHDSGHGLPYKDEDSDEPHKAMNGV